VINLPRSEDDAFRLVLYALAVLAVVAVVVLIVRAIF